MDIPLPTAAAESERRGSEAEAAWQESLQAPQSTDKAGPSGNCDFDRGQPAKKYTDIPALDRLIFPRAKKLDRLYANTPKPNGLVPEPFLPIWPELPTDTKIPIVPAPPGIFELYRGEIGTGLYRPVIDFTLTDPHNRERVVTAAYTALHDPHARGLYANASELMYDYLVKTKAITVDSLVRCTIKEFNDYRRYLNKRHYLADLTSNFEQMEKIRALEKAQVQAIRKDLNKTEGKAFKIAQAEKRAKELYDSKMNALKERFMLKNAYTEFRAEAHSKAVIGTKSNRLLQSIAKENQVRTRIGLAKQADAARRLAYARRIVEKEHRTEEFIRTERCRKAREREQLLIDWLADRCAAQQVQIDSAAATKKVVAATLKQRAMKRQKKAEAFRATMGDRIVARLAEQKRIWGLVRKFFYRWVSNVRKRKARRPDEFHRSYWQIPTEIEITLKYLREESGYEKFDEFIMNIVKLKRDILAEQKSQEQFVRAQALGMIPEGEEYEEEEEDEPYEKVDEAKGTTGPPAPEVSPPGENPIRVARRSSEISVPESQFLEDDGNLAGDTIVEDEDPPQS